MTVKLNPGSREQSQELFVATDHKQKHVTHLILVTLLLVLVTHGRPHRGTVCLLPFKDRNIPFEASELSQQEVHFQEPASPVDHSVISGRPVRTSLESSLPEAQLQSEGTGTVKSELDLEDKYNIASFDNDLILTNDYYEYEQGQKEIIVEIRLKIISTFWKTVLKANSSVIDTIEMGTRYPSF